MLREIRILKDNQIIFQEVFGSNLEENSFDVLWKLVERDIQNNIFTYEDTLVRYYYKYRLSIKCNYSKRILIIFITDLANEENLVTEEINNFTIKFFWRFADEEELTERFINANFSRFQVLLEQVYYHMWPKVSIIGFSGVGKTSIRYLIKSEEVPEEHVPTISGEIDPITDGKNIFRLFDFAGQKQYQGLWDRFLKNSDAVLLISDSSKENLKDNKKLLRQVKENCPHAYIALIANKQDLPDRVQLPEIIELFGGIDVYPMIAKDKRNREFMLTILADVLEMSNEYIESPINAFDKLVMRRNQKQAELEEQTIIQHSQVSSLTKIPENPMKLESWVLNAQKLVHWVLQKAKEREAPMQWALTKEFLMKQTDFNFNGKFDEVWFQLLISPYGKMQNNHFVINEDGMKLHRQLTALIVPTEPVKKETIFMSFIKKVQKAVKGTSGNSLKI